MLGDRFKMHWG